jgi:hypothetical protein
MREFMDLRRTVNDIWTGKPSVIPYSVGKERHVSAA